MTPHFFLLWAFARVHFGVKVSVETPRIKKICLGSKGGTVVKAFASHQSGPGSNPGVNAICGLSLLLVLSLAPRGFSLGTPVFPSPQKPTLPNTSNTRTCLNKIIRTPKCFVNKQIICNLEF